MASLLEVRVLTPPLLRAIAGGYSARPTRSGATGITNSGAKHGRQSHGGHAKAGEVAI